MLKTVLQAVGMFAVTNIDDVLILALFFGRAAGQHAGALRVTIGQYLGFGAILAAALLGSLGAGLLPTSAIRYLGVLPILLGLRAAWSTWRERRAGQDGDREVESTGRVRIWEVALVTAANGGDNIGVYVPVFAPVPASGLITYCVVFLVGVAVWCVAGRFLATRPAIARGLSRWGHLILPAVLISIGTAILLS